MELRQEELQSQRKRVILVQDEHPAIRYNYSALKNNSWGDKKMG